MQRNGETIKRITITLNGIWDVEESVLADRMPGKYTHTVPVPGLISSAQPPFPDAGRYDTREYQYNNKVLNVCERDPNRYPVDQEVLTAPRGVSRQEQNYYWYRRNFSLSVEKENITLLVRKAQYGSSIWVNGCYIGEHLSCFTAKIYDISHAVNRDGDNEIIIRVGAHPGVLPDNAYVPVDFEKNRWLSGVWDDVEIHCFDGPEVRSVQTAARIDPRQITARTVLANTDSTDKTVTLLQKVTDKHGTILAEREKSVTIPSLGTAEVTSMFSVPGAELWCPENPVLYTLVTETPGDCVETRVGVREFRFDTPTRSAYLNGEKIFLRGGLVAFGRLTDDTTCGTLPWEDDWVRRAIGERPRDMHWNFLKLCIHPVPERWLRIADETGMMLLSEFPIWTISPEVFSGYQAKLDREIIQTEMLSWMLEQANHASVIYFNSCLESYVSWLPEVVEEVRSYDFSDRPWSNGWHEPSRPDDPVEDHQYEYAATGLPAEWGVPGFDPVQLEQKCGIELQHTSEMPSAHAVVMTEYGYLFVSRDGKPTPLSERVYGSIDFPSDTPDEVFRTHAYLHAGLTEYWRAFRQYAGIMMISYLAWNDPGKCSAGYMSDLKELKFHPYFEEYVADAFHPLGVYLNFWQKELHYGEDPNPYRKKFGDPDEQLMRVMVCNDDKFVRKGEIVIMLENDTETLELERKPFSVAPNGQMTLRFMPKVPHVSGSWTLKATAFSGDGAKVCSRRWVSVSSR